MATAAAAMAMDLATLSTDRGCAPRRTPIGSAALGKKRLLHVCSVLKAPERATEDAKLRKTVSVGVLGASGYTGSEVVRLLATHPFFSVELITADRKAGQSFASVFPHLIAQDLPDLVAVGDADFSKIDAVFCCLPHGTTQEIIAGLPQHLKVVDLSADFRLHDVQQYEEWYGAPHRAPELQKSAVYGLTEMKRDAVSRARLVANPGCYPTSVQLPLMPLLERELIEGEDIIIDAKSGVSGAGRGAKEANLYTEAAAEADVRDAKAAVARAEADVRDAKAAALRDPAYVPLYAAAQETLRTAMIGLQSLQARGSVASGGAGNIDVVSVLVKEFGAKLRDARAVEWESNPLRDSHQILLKDGNLVCDQDPGVYFSISAREDTLSSLVKGAAQAYRNCTREDNLITSRDTGIRAPHFNAVIAYPGAGKTTIGTDYPGLLRRFWSESGERVLLESMSANVVAGFSKMIEDSWHYRCSLYHNIADYEDGKLANIEWRILRSSSSDGYNKILALRFLFAAISKPVPDLSYKDFLELLPEGFFHRVTFDDVLIFIRKGLNISHDRQIFMSFFLDEINCAEIVVRTDRGDISWIQQILSTYVHCISGSAKKTKVVPAVTVSCTRHEAASLRLTASRRTLHFPIPVFTLQQQDCANILKDFFQRLSVALGSDCSFEPNEHLLLCVKMAGGMPRFLGYMLRGMLTSHPMSDLSGKALLDAARTFDYQRMVQTLRNSITLNCWDPFKYRTGAGFMVLMAALRHALLGTTVCRSMPVTGTDEISNMEENNWGRLEQKAVISLQLVDTRPVEESEFCPCKVVFPPLLALSLQEARVDIFSSLFPSAMARGFRSRELNDLKFLAFMMLLFRNSTLVPRQSFGLRDIIPCAWGYHRDFVDVRLPCTEAMRLYQAEDSTPLTGPGLRAMRMKCGHDFGLLCDGNRGPDSLFVFPDFVIVLQSRSSDAVKAPPLAGPRKVFWSCFSDLAGIAKLSKVDVSEFGPPPDNLRKDVCQLLDNMEAGNSQSMEVGAPWWPRTRLSTGTKLKLRYKSLEGFDNEVEYSDEDNYPLDRINFSEEQLSAELREKIRTSENPLLKQTILRNQDCSYPGVYDVLCEVRHQVPLASLGM